MTQKTGQYPTQCLHNKQTLRETLACFIQSTCFGYTFVLYFFIARQAPSGPEPPYCRGFTITPRHTTLGRTPLNEWSARRRDLYIITHDPHTRHTSMPREGFEPATPKASDRTPSYTARPLGSPRRFPILLSKYLLFFLLFLPTRTAQAYHNAKITMLSTYGLL